MNVLHIMDYAAPYRGNFLPSIQNLEEKLELTGGRLIFMFPETAKGIDWVIELQTQGHQVYFINTTFFSKKIKFSEILKLREIIKKERVSILHTHFVAYNYTLAFMKFCFLLNEKTIGNFMNEFLPPRNKYYKFKVSVTNLSFNKIIASSAAVKESVIKSGINGNKVSIVYNALDTNHLKREDIINFRDNKEQKIILMFGWTFLRKGVDIAIRAVSNLIAENADLKLVIAMAGGQEITKNEIVKIMGYIPDWINIMGPIANIATYYNSADIFLSSSREEGFTYSVLEAAFCNPMIAASNIGGHPMDIPFIGKFETENVENLTDVIRQYLLKTEEERSLMKSAQRDYVTRVYNIDNWSKDIIKIYSEISYKKFINISEYAI
jgi:glycosyltransferase involved in cell wall biosynthesis